MKRIVTVACLVAGTLLADTTPVMVSLVTPVQAPSRNYDVTGLRLSLIYGECQDFTGLDIGVIDNTRKDFTGLAIGGINCVGDRLYGDRARDARLRTKPRRLLLHAVELSFPHPADRKSVV